MDWGVGWATVSTMQMHYRESRGYRGAEVEEESICSAFVALDPSDSRSWKPQVRILCHWALNV